jgi:lysylphosphatidylglycerol synthetase-like protein (DUF2156 family)
VSAVTDNLEPTQPLKDAVLVLVFTALIAIGWINWLPLGVVFAAVLLPFLIRRNPKTQKFAPWASVYVGASAFLNPPLNFSNLLEHLSWMALGLVLGLLIGLAFDGIQERNHWAWLAGLILLILNPSAAGVIGVLGLCALGAFGARSSRIRVGVQFQNRSGMIMLAVLGLTVAAFSVLLTRPTGFQFNDANIVVSKPKTKTKPKSTVSSLETTNSARSSVKRVPTLDSNLRNVLLLANFALLLVMMVLLFALLRNRTRTAKGQRKPDFFELIPLFGAFIVLLALFVWASTPPHRLEGAKTPADIQNTSQNPTRGKPTLPPETKLEQTNRTSPIWTAVMLLIVLMAGYWAYRITREKTANSSPEEPETNSNSSLVTPIQASNRVREAYRAFLELCKAQGIRRANDQTSIEFAALVGTLVPNLNLEVLHLTELYEPVRYGRLSDEAGALEAEHIVKTLKLILEPPPKGEPR